MIKFRLPKLHNMVKVNKEDEINLCNYIYVFSETACVVFDPLSSEFGRASLFVNLREYLKNEVCDDYAEQVEEVNAVLQMLEGNAFTPELWKMFQNTVNIDLTGSDFITVRDNGLVYDVYLKNALNTISYDKNIMEIKKSISSYFNQGIGENSDRVNAMMNGSVAERIYKSLAKEFKDDTLSYVFNKHSQSFMFHFIRRNYVYGTYSIEQSVTGDLFAYDTSYNYLMNMI